MLLLIDGNPIVHRSFHAIPQTIKTSKGELTNATLGFTNSVLSLIEHFKPESIACAFDTSKKTFRHERYEEYKATRVEAPQGLYDQLPRIFSILKALNIATITAPGYEADDIIGTLVDMAEKAKLRGVIIVSGDNDFIQLVSPLTSFYSISRGLQKAVTFTPEKVKETSQLSPEQWIDYKALRGDPSDNLIGIPGIGEKTAKELLLKWHDLDGIYTHIEELKPQTKKKLIENKESAILTKELVTIHRQVPLDVTLKDLAYQEPNNVEMYNLCTELEFRKLAERFENSALF
ncbi:MAG: hypothetical protein A2V81_02065 [Candidatus Abawacabacteria bacterium RBG_16_42_10]|uniref:5'-3' exonuclease domain-containing protein n=1 Tax=Candidatus Abawacabacteria bacterium RBG_16_42_10 TaxID=1817814 RepID=A0A1F4XKX2_9BACT|nr:MAG: hypothetical protein A2V81_02065 [Candidatus Abawacabacteria bacterium RBG_16_42_10]